MRRLMQVFIVIMMLTVLIVPGVNAGEVSIEWTGNATLETDRGLVGQQLELEVEFTNTCELPIVVNSSILIIDWGVLQHVFGLVGDREVDSNETVSWVTDSMLTVPDVDVGNYNTTVRIVAMTQNGSEPSMANYSGTFRVYEFPDISVVITPSGTSGTAPYEVGFTVYISNYVGECTFVWDWGDGTKSTTTGNHIYQSGGTYVATLTVTDSMGRFDQASQTIEVRDSSIFDDPMVIVGAVVAVGLAVTGVAIVLRKGRKPPENG